MASKALIFRWYLKKKYPVVTSIAAANVAPKAIPAIAPSGNISLSLTVITVALDDGVMAEEDDMKVVVIALVVRAMSDVNA
jgi:hypothetical protein